MYTFDTELRVRYGETDKMGYVYYGNYAMYYEVARVESIRHLGFAYSDLEAQGIMMPVLESYSKFIKPAKYDELLKIVVRIPEIPGIKITFEYEIFNEGGELINKGNTLLTFIKMTTGKPCRPPEQMVKLLQPYYNEK